MEEAIECFLRQNALGISELVVVNDFDQQTLIFDHPRVTIVNLPKRCQTIGEKRNIASNLSKGKYLMPWDDDDIHLPDRISRLYDFASCGNHRHVTQGAYYSLKTNGHYEINYHSHAGMHLLEKDLWEEVGEYTEMNSEEDQDLNKKLRSIVKPVKCSILPPEFIYRWSTTKRPHLSGFGKDSDGKISGTVKIQKIAEQNVKSGSEPKGIVHLKPYWSKDWVQDLRKKGHT